MKSLVRVLLLASAGVALGGCGLWGGSDEIQPSELVEFEAEKQVEVQWQARIGDGPGEAFHQFIPAVGAERVFAASREGVVTALSRESGDELWEVDLDTTLSAGAGEGFGTLVVADESGLVIALDASSGEELWRHTVSSEVVAQPQVNADLVVVQVINGQVAAFDRVTGESLWTFDSQIPQLSLRGTGAPVLTEQVTLAGFANGKIIAIDNRNGMPIWEQRVSSSEGRSELERIADVDGRPLVFNGSVYVAGYQGQLISLNPYAAQITWSQDFSSYRSLAAGFGNIYAVSADDEVAAFDANSSASVWQQSDLRFRQLTSPAVLGTTVVVGDNLGFLHFMSQIDGHFVARYDYGDSGLLSDPVVVDDTLYVLGNDGRLSALKLN
jgi:outer membrane protein assembly factor BamB